MESNKSNLQIDFFELFDNKSLNCCLAEKTTKNSVDDIKIKLIKYDNYNLDMYSHDVLTYGLNATWDSICKYVLNSNTKNNLLNIDNLSNLYEKGLAIQDKENKKKCGQYYTPDDVAIVLANWFKDLDGSNICDVGCGTGKLILSYLNIIGKDNAIQLVKSGKLYLYELDNTALNICKTIILLKYGKELEPFIHAYNCNFLSKEVLLPVDCKVISNPPYSAITSILNDWEKTEIATTTKELYSIFMEKIIKNSKSSVIITPYSFIGGNKFYYLRKLMNNYNGYIVSFDNVPGNIFYGKKQGVFNTNQANSVRAAITVVENKKNCNGFKLTPLIRFKQDERKKLLNNKVLESFIYPEYQIVSKEQPMYYKCAKELGEVWDIWNKKSSKILGDYIDKSGKYILSMPNTCRYYTTAYNGLMNRKGQIILNFNDENIFNYIYCLINSSFAYWYWRLFDGGITYQKGLLLSMPVFFDLLTSDDIAFFNNTARELIANSSKYIIKKNNVGVQENIKFPKEFRDAINRRLLDILNINKNENAFNAIHSNLVFKNF